MAKKTTFNSCEFVKFMAKRQSEKLFHSFSAYWNSNYTTTKMPNIILKEDSFEVIGKCMEVHKNLGCGFLEIVFKDALEIKFRLSGIRYDREKRYKIEYKDVKLPHLYYTDFVNNDKIILEVKCTEVLSDVYRAQCLNYLNVSGNRLAILVNFNKVGLKYERIVL